MPKVAATIVIIGKYFRFIIGLVFAATMIAAAEIGNWYLAYIASRNSDAFHLLTCQWAAKMNEGNRVYLETFQDAVSSGRRPCGVCKPKEDLRAWLIAKSRRALLKGS